MNCSSNCAFKYAWIEVGGRKEDEGDVPRLVRSAGGARRDAGDMAITSTASPIRSRSRLRQLSQLETRRVVPRVEHGPSAPRVPACELERFRDVWPLERVDAFVTEPGQHGREILIGEPGGEGPAERVERADRSISEVDGAPQLWVVAEERSRRVERPLPRNESRLHEESRTVDPVLGDERSRRIERDGRGHAERPVCSPRSTRSRALLARRDRKVDHEAVDVVRTLSAVEAIALQDHTLAWSILGDVVRSRGRNRLEPFGVDRQVRRYCADQRCARRKSGIGRVRRMVNRSPRATTRRPATRGRQGRRPHRRSRAGARPSASSSPARGCARSLGRTRSLARGAPLLKRNPRRSVNVNVLKSLDTAGAVCATSGTSSDLAGAGLSGWAISRAHVVSTKPTPSAGVRRIDALEQLRPESDAERAPLSRGRTQPFSRRPRGRRR